jgi:hypothetical protein
VPFQVELNEQELKLILAAIRQARHTIAVAQRQEEGLAGQYAELDQMYEDVHNKLNEFLEPSPPGPVRVK